MNTIHEDLPALIENEYAVHAARIEQLNLGFDQNTRVYKLTAHGNTPYFLKIRLGNFTGSSLAVPYWLSAEMGFSHIIEPIRAKNKALYVKKPPLHLMLFPYIDGASGWDAALTGDQFAALGTFMRRLHSVKPPPGLAEMLPAETYSPRYRNLVRGYFKALNSTGCGAGASAFPSLLKEKENAIAGLIGQAETALKEILNTEQQNCLCHGDIHAGNILIGKDSFYAVDWDTVLLAPKERDLMFIGGGIGNKWNREEEAAAFYQGYGRDSAVCKNLIRYYRCERIIQDVHELYQQIMDKKTSPHEREICVELFKQQFEADNAADRALRIF
jgi:spectinomycin phosphotransferase